MSDGIRLALERLGVAQRLFGASGRCRQSPNIHQIKSAQIDAEREIQIINNCQFNSQMFKPLTDCKLQSTGASPEQGAHRESVR
jgi:hypothetical protein